MQSFRMKSEWGEGVKQQIHHVDHSELRTEHVSNDVSMYAYLVVLKTFKWENTDFVPAKT